MLRSGDLPEGKYITMDVGAGTVDLNFFFKRGNANSTDESSIDTWVAKVVPLGCACLDEPNDNAGEHEKTRGGINRETMRSRLTEEISNLMQRVFLLQPRRVVGDGPDVFHNGVHAYILGGGANVALYGNTFKKTLDDMDIRVAQIMRLPRPDMNYVLPDGVNDFGRLAIAYGISSSHENLERVRLPAEMMKVLVNAQDAARRNRDECEMACSCFANPDCAKCSGTGWIKREKLTANLEAIELWSAKRSIDLAKETRTERSSAIPESKTLSDYIKNITGLLRIRAIVSMYIIIKRMEYLQKILPKKYYDHIITDSQSAIAKAINKKIEEEVEIDLESHSVIGNGFDANVTFMAPKGKRLTKRISPVVSCS
jgi:hypothetical protein